MKKIKNEIKEDNEIREYFILMARTIERDRLLDVMRVKQGAKDKEIIMWFRDIINYVQLELSKKLHDEYYKEGKTIKEISNECDYSTTSVFRKILNYERKLNKKT